MDEQDDLLNRIKENVLRLRHVRPERVVPPIDDTAERTRNSIRKLAQSRIAEILRQLRAAHGMSYEEIQQRTGLSQQMLFDLEYKERRLSMRELQKLADCFHVGVNDIIGIDMDQS